MKLDTEMRNSQSNDESDEDDDSTSESDSSDYIYYRDRPEWADIEPMSIRSQASIMNIKYSPRYEETFSYFRALLARDELSERSFALTADCIELQRSNFSVWYFRRRILKKLKHHLHDELAFVERAIDEEPKNYQVWNHRKIIIEWLQDGSREKLLTASMLVIDNKNYHAWQHRQWAIKHFNLWDGEIQYTDTQLAIDALNNSAWSHRFYVVKETRLYENPTWIEEEIRRVHQSIKKYPTNESSWSYLRGILLLSHGCLESHKETSDLCDQLYLDRGHSIHLLAFILDTTKERLCKALPTNSPDIVPLKAKVDEICRILESIDDARSRYWKYIESKIHSMY